MSKVGGGVVDVHMLSIDWPWSSGGRRPRHPLTTAGWKDAPWSFQAPRCISTRGRYFEVWRVFVPAAMSGFAWSRVVAYLVCTRYLMPQSPRTFMRSCGFALGGIIGGHLAHQTRTTRHEGLWWQGGLVSVVFRPFWPCVACGATHAGQGFEKVKRWPVSYRR